MYDNGEVGTLEIGHLNQEPNKWTITKAVQLLSSNDKHIANLSSHQLKDTITNISEVNNSIPVNDFISGQITDGLYYHRYYHRCKFTHLWNRIKLASHNQLMNIDISDLQNIKICIDDIYSDPSKLLKSLRLALRYRWTINCLHYPLQIAVAQTFELADSSKGITRLVSH